jgi:LmbE family N-acetylglucosaminyl deacetylase
MTLSRPPVQRRPVTPPGHRPDVWASRVVGDRSLSVEDLAPESSGRILVVAGAHPDDETLGAGRLVSQWRRDRGPVVGVLATAGEACVDQMMPRPAGIAGRRLAEWDAALDRLGVARRARLDLPDGDVAAHELVIMDRLASLCVSGDVAALAAPSRIDSHPDHRAVGRAAAAVARDNGVVLLEYPVWLTYWADPGDCESTQLIRVRTDAVAEMDRAAALSCFATQLSPLADDLEPVVPEAMLDHHPEQRLVIGLG